MKQLAYQSTPQPVLVLTGCELGWINRVTNEPGSIIENPNQVRLKAALKRRDLSQKKEEAKRLLNEIF